MHWLMSLGAIEGRLGVRSTEVSICDNTVRTQFLIKAVLQGASQEFGWDFQRSAGISQVFVWILPRDAIGERGVLAAHESSLSSS